MERSINHLRIELNFDDYYRVSKINLIYLMTIT